ncbi:MAG: U32 family peptidase [Methanosarcinales archaeon]|nr:U32 family peptidase [Methanosarcinales archaeon]
MHKPELLAPAGSKEALIAAVENGADAVYFGGEAYSARYDAALSNDEIEWAIDYAHINKTKAYATVNTLIKDSELEKVCEYLQFLCNAGADAVIVQDMGILKLIKDQLPLLPVHASTQMTIHNMEGVRFLEDMGVKRVVLARELSLNEIRKIKSETKTEIEVFIHGALCFSYSGQCLFSSMIGEKSGNRGYCTQPCRRKYTIDGAKGYLLSPKDLNISEHIGLLIESGIDSFKIEGRLKRPEYVAGVVRTYRMLIERYLENAKEFHVSYEEKHALRQLFNRDFTSGYIFGNPGSDLMSRKQPHNQGTYLGNVVKYDWNRKFAYIHIEQPLRIGDGIGTQGRGTGTTVRSMYINNQSVETTPSCATVKIPMEKVIYRNETVFKTYDSKLMDSFGLKDIMKKIPITISFTAKPGKPIIFCITDGENKVSIKGEIPGKAKGAPTSQESIIQQLKKLGNTFFESENIILDLDDKIFIPISQLNSLRKIAVDKLKAERTKNWKRTCKKPEIIVNSRDGKYQPVLSVNTCSIETFEAAVDNGADIVYFDGECVRDPLIKEDYDHIIEYAKKKEVKVYLNTPRIVKEFEASKPSVNPDGFLVANQGDLYRLHNSIDKKSLIIDYPFNVFNRVTMTYYLDYCQRVTLSPELTLDEIQHIASNGPVECIVHGFFPLMLSEHDLLGALFPDDNIHYALLEDEKGFTYQITTDRQKRTYIMTSRELCMLNYIPRIIESGVSCLRIEAKTYDKKTTGKWTQSYRKAIDNRTKDRCKADSSTGHYFKGVL